MKQINLELELKPNATASETFIYFKYLERYVRAYFIGVTDFKCEKKHNENKATLHFFFCGIRPNRKELENNELNLLFNAKSI